MSCLRRICWNLSSLHIHRVMVVLLSSWNSGNICFLHFEWYKFWNWSNLLVLILGFLRDSVVKNLPANEGRVGDMGSNPGLGRFPGVENAYPLQYSCLENPMDRGTWWATVQFSSVQSLSIWLFATSWTATHQASLSMTNSQSLVKLMSIESVMSSNISSSLIPFSAWLQPFSASGSFPMSQFFKSGGQKFQFQHQSFQWIFRTDFL